ncbi:asparagine synthase (glutamine-hydrolyzing) [Desmospora profundinema]|uniref:asparagine synthase (glutamine-hydrolyzing) n=1 Tax=Desmospora profundinema TaxID=1571184 RepID=A0ABU1IMF4_9BACL|nr:asparagine synthase (glutamine-hydrolyzing) [Desmospora profundinema]MDR6225339.1 asparagine synthase (glutamine-hydrolyzing) [Desmospora profundinema]
MCGISGLLNWDHDLSARRDWLEKMNETLVPRGPDAEGIWISRCTGLAHRRLIVIDPEGGVQPMVRRYGDRNLVITYNGELYNMEELSRELINRGHTFQSRSDTELILAAYAEWGTEAPRRLNGIFAFAIWDEREESLFLARDRIGVKPLFYAVREGAVSFGSELKSLLALADIQPEVDTEGLAEVLAMGPSRTPGHGVFKGVEELRPGHWMKMTRDTKRVEAYWKLESRSHTDDRSTTIERVRELFIDAVQRQLVSDVSIGTMLSGGLDSSAISACAASHFDAVGKGPLPTFSVDYEGNDRFFQPNEFQPNADAPWVERMSQYIGSNHHRVLIDNAELAGALYPALKSRDLPGMADVDASLLLFCRQIKKHATVVLSGECADEVFGGYPWFHREEMIRADTFPWSRKIRERIAFLSPEVNRAIRPEEYVQDRYREALAEVPCLEGEKGLEARIREIFYLNLTRWMPTLLDRKDRMSMAVGLEVRVPFCDHHLVEYVWNIPWSMKRMNGREKGLFREAMKGILPDDVLYRQKSPYPKTHNPAYLEAVKEEALRILNDSRSPVRQLLDLDAVRSFASRDLTREHLPWFGQLMNVPQLFAHWIQLDQWMRDYRVRIV